MTIPQYPGNFSARALDSSQGLPAGFTLLDIREVGEFEAGHAPGAVNFPFSQMPGRVEHLPEGQLVLTCRTGARSAQAMDYLNLQGHRVWNMRDGMVGWKLAGLPVVREDGTEGIVA